MTMSFGTSLYYPYINFQNDNWMKMAALYYDKLYRIVPKDHHTEDSDFVSELIESHDFVKNVEPKKYSKKIEEDFMDFASAKLRDDAYRQQVQNVIKLNEFSETRFDIHERKLSYGLIKKMEELKLINPAQKGRFYGFDYISGIIYMTYLANEIALEKSINITSEKQSFRSLIDNVYHLYPKDEMNSDVGYIVSSYVIENAVPYDINSLEGDDIIRIREKYERDRINYYDAVNEQISEVKTIKDPSSITDFCVHHNKTIERELKNLKKSFRDANIKTVSSFSTISLPPIITDLALKFPNYSYQIEGAGALLTGIKIYYDRRIRINSLKRNSPWSYIINLEQENPRTILNRLKKAYRRVGKKKAPLLKE